jgi:uncharacterized OsmC-like protein
LDDDRPVFTLNLEWIDHLSFKVRWDLPDAPDVLMDEPPELGGSGEGPNATRMVVAGVANCLAASLLFCLQKSKVDMKGYSIRAHGEVTRNENGRLRLSRIRIEPLVRMGTEDTKRLSRCLELFEDYCIVTESIRKGIPVDLQVIVVDEEGNEIPAEEIIDG